MAGFERYIAKLTARVENRMENAIDRMRGPRAPRHVAAYRGFGTATEVFVSGRVLANDPPTVASESDSWIRNLHNAYRRLESDELPGIVVRAALAGVATDAVTDDEGFFRTWIKLPQPLPRRLWHEGVLHVTPGDAPPIVQPFHVLTPPPAAAFGIISDLDDTVVHTRATSPIRMARDILFGNSRTRLPFHGVAAFYRALHGGTEGDPLNPIFYVSSSPWNLHDFLLEFLQVRGIPVGPLMLRDWGTERDSLLPPGHHEHKSASIERVFSTYPALSFLLIGDSGQQDPEIYRDIVERHPGRVLAVYIRDVSLNPIRTAAVHQLAAEVAELGSVMVLVEDTVAAARHAADHGWIAPERVEAVARDLMETSEGSDGEVA